MKIFVPKKENNSNFIVQMQQPRLENIYRKESTQNAERFFWDKEKTRHDLSGRKPPEQINQ